MPTPPCNIVRFQAPDGRSLAARYFPASAGPNGSVVLLHGIVSHSGWYDLSARHLAAEGFDVYALDRRGSGLNTADRGDVDRWQTWVSDVVAFCETHRAPGPLVLLGISWGGKLAPVVARQRPDLVAGFGMLCPGLFARQQPGLAGRWALAASGPLGIDRPRATIPLTDPALFTNSPHWQTFVRDDPLTLRTVTMRFARQDQALTRYARSSPRFVHTPALLVLAGQDRIVHNRRTRNYFAALASGDKTLREYQTAAHTLEFEPDPRPFFDDLTDWTARVVARHRH